MYGTPRPHSFNLKLLTVKIGGLESTGCKQSFSHNVPEARISLTNSAVKRVDRNVRYCVRGESIDGCCIQ